MTAAFDAAFDRAVKEALAPPPPLSLSDWADRHARVPMAGNAQPGRWKPFRYQVEWLQCMADPAVKTVVVQKSARIGYTRCLIHCASYYIAQDPSPVLIVLPRESDSEDFSRSEILPALLDTPALFEVSGDLRSRSTEQRVSKRVFKNGASVAFVGANSPNSFRRISARIVLFDEVDAFPAELGQEGDAVALGVKRSETFHSRRIVLGSTPTTKFESRIEKAFNGSDMRRFHVTCPSCGHEQTLRWQQLKWEKTEAGEHLPDTVYYECEKSGCVITEDQKPAMIEAGRWVAEKPFAGVAGFHINTLYSPFPNACWSNLVREWLVACRDEVLLRTFVNTTLGEPFEQRGTSRPWGELAARARSSSYKKGTVPEGAALLFLGIDCQFDRIEHLLVGRGSNNRKFIIDYGVIRWPISEADGQRALNQLLRQQWRNYCGIPMSITMAAIDAGYETSSVLEFCKGRREIIAVRGLSGSYKPAIAKVKSEKHGKRGDVLRHPRDGYFTVGIDSIKSGLFADLAKDDPDAAGYIAFPSDAEDRLYQELTAEHRIAVKRLGQIVFRWEKIADRQANELLDCYVYAQAAMARHGCTWISAERWRELETQCGGKPPPGFVFSGPQERAGKRIVRIIEQLPR
jgi:terminase, large subunit